VRFTGTVIFVYCKTLCSLRLIVAILECRNFSAF